MRKRKNDLLLNTNNKITKEDINKFCGKIIQNSPNSMWLSDEKGTMIMQNQVNRDLFDITDEQVVGVYNLFKDEEFHKENLIPLIDKVFYEKQPVHFMLDYTPAEIKHAHLTMHSALALDVTITPIIIKNKVVNAIVQHRNITERVKAQRALAEETERLNIALKSISDGVVAVGAKGEITILNRMAEHILGWKQKEVIGKPFDAIIHLFDEKTNAMAPNPLQKALETGKIIELKKDVVLISKRGKSRLIDNTAAPIKNKEGDIVGAVAVFRDITLQRKTELELSKSQKLEAVGVMAGGIAHDFNNILTAISGNVELALMHSRRHVKSDQVLDEPDLKLENEVINRLVQALKACKRAKSLTQQLLTFSSGGLPVRRTVSIKEIIMETTTFTTSGCNSKIEYNIPEDIPNAHIDPGQISQVIQNILINAMQSMPTGGVIKLAAREVKAPMGVPCDAHLKPGAYLEVTIADKGIGIPKEHLNKIFDPYFTTKHAGSGLGLATAYSVIKNHEGCVWVDSELGKGSTFFLYLPTTLEEIKEEDLDAHLNGRGNVLFVDDQAPVREIAKDLIEDLGYTVTVVSCGEAALETYKGSMIDKHFDAVVIDLTMPGGMDGIETIKRLLEIDKQVKAIVSSGYSTSNAMSNYKDYGFKDVIQKPFTLETLAKVLHDVTKS